MGSGQLSEMRGVDQPLFVRRLGKSGPPLVLLHGFGASGRYWRSVAERLAPAARVICPDLLGFGRSPWPDGAYTVADHLAALNATLDSLRLRNEPIVLGGHSTGAILALQWAAARSDAFCSVALIALPAYRSAVEARAGVSRISPLTWATAAAPRVGEIVCDFMCATRPVWRAVMPLLNPSVPADIARDFVLHDWASSHGTLEHVIINNPIAPAASRLTETTMPVRLLHGTRDRQAPFAAVRELADRCGWPLTVLEGAGHYLPIRAPQACANLLRTVTAPIERIHG